MSKKNQPAILFKSNLFCANIAFLAKGGDYKVPERYLRAAVRFRCSCPNDYRSNLITLLGNQGLVSEVVSDGAVHTFKILWPERLEEITMDWYRFFIDPPDVFWVRDGDELSEVMVRSAV